MKLMVLGIDGMEPSLYRKWKDELPNLRRIEEYGGFAELESTFPPLSGPAWTSFMTGKNPGGHGIFDFVELTRDKELRPLNGADIDGETLHELIAEEYRVGVVNMPFTYPPADIDGCIVSGMTAPGTDTDFATPEDLQDELRAMDYEIEWTKVFQEGNEDRWVGKIDDVIEKRTDAFRKVIDRDCDVFIGVYTITDRVQHWFWKHMDEDHPMHRDEHEEYSDIIKETYIKIDQEIGDLLDENDPDNIIILSDHGFGRIDHSLNMNIWLMENGYLTIKDNLLSQLKYAGFKAGFTLKNIYSVIQKLGLSELLNRTTEETRSFFSRFFLGFSDIDWEQTRAFSVGNFGPIYLNDGRWDGPVSDSDRKKLIDGLKDDLKTLQYQDEQVITDIFEREEIFGDDRRGPDLLFTTKDMRYMASRYFEFGADEVISDNPPRNLTAHHRTHGIFLADGDDLQGPEEASIVDLAPTLLHLTGLGIPPDVDGTVLDIFTDGSGAAEREPQFREDLSQLSL
jgi:predicted AlkP superfamily phosphohydrolase/phosphomutase